MTNTNKIVISLLVGIFIFLFIPIVSISAIYWLMGDKYDVVSKKENKCVRYR
jgi:hypothetical protein